MGDSSTVQVSVEVIHSPAHSTSATVFYVYFVSFTNLGADTVRLRRRHFLIRDGNGDAHEVDGEGVVGEQPYIAPGATYRYSSGVPIRVPPGSMSGYYTFENGDGSSFRVALPEFALYTPDGYSNGGARTIN
jgi:ApaG protein